MEAQKSSTPANNQKGQTRLKPIRVLMPKHNAVDMAMVSIESDPFGSSDQLLKVLALVAGL